MISLVSALDNASRLFEIQFFESSSSIDSGLYTSSNKNTTMMMMLHHRHCSVSTMNAIKLFSDQRVSFSSSTTTKHFTSLVFPYVLPPSPLTRLGFFGHDSTNVVVVRRHMKMGKCHGTSQSSVRCTCVYGFYTKCRGEREST